MTTGRNRKPEGGTEGAGPSFTNVGDPRDRPNHYRPKGLLMNAIKRKGFTIGGVAQLLGLDRSTLSRQLNGKEHMTDRTLVRLSNLLGIDPRVALGWGDKTHDEIVEMRSAIAECINYLTGENIHTDICEYENGQMVNYEPAVFEVKPNTSFDPTSPHPPYLVRVPEWVSLGPDEGNPEGMSVDDWREMQFNTLDKVLGDWRDPAPLAREMFEYAMTAYADGALRCVDALAEVPKM